MISSSIIIMINNVVNSKIDSNSLINVGTLLMFILIGKNMWMKLI